MTKKINKADKTPEAGENRKEKLHHTIDKLMKLSAKHQDAVMKIIGKYPSRKEFNVLLLTPYLIETLSQKIERIGVENIQKQMDKYGYRPDKVITDKLFENDDMIVNFVADMKNLLLRDDLDERILNIPKKEKFTFAVHGSTTGAEEDVENLKKTDVPIGRYSIFYGKNSENSGKSASEGGYSFDIPKNPDIVRKLITDTDFLTALQEKDIQAVKNTLKDLNKKFISMGGKVLITSYLEECLNK